MSDTADASNVERFLAAFQAIEGNLRDRAVGPTRDGHVSFPELLRGARGVIPRRLELDLRELSELRNALVHGTNGRIMAHPTDDAVAEIEHIRRSLVSPPRAIDVVGRGAVVTITSGASLATAIARMRTGGFSQLPAYDGPRSAGLLTTEAIVRWLADIATTGPVPGLDAVRVADVLQHADTTDECRFLPESVTALEALDAFDHARREGRELVIIIVGEAGGPDVTPLAIVTVHDMPQLVDAIYPWPGEGGDPGP